MYQRETQRKKSEGELKKKKKRGRPPHIQIEDRNRQPLKDREGNAERRAGSLGRVDGSLTAPPRAQSSRLRAEAAPPSGAVLMGSLASVTSAFAADQALLRDH